MGEFELIEAFFQAQPNRRSDVVLGIGDDCALLNVPPDCELAVSIDTLVSGVHFLPEHSPADIGYKALTASLSDLAAMGASPAWVTLAVTLPHLDIPWVAEFARGFLEVAAEFQVQLIGGDTTKGPLCITVQVHGFIPKGKALKRAGAKAGDFIYVTGTLGDAGLALLLGAKAPEFLQQRLLRPRPRIEDGLSLRDIASSAIDVSDGLAADLSHILKCSKVGAVLQLNRIPLSDDVMANTSLAHAQELALSAGDDYELCFTVPPEKISLVAPQHYCIGHIVSTPGLQIVNADGSHVVLKKAGYVHF